MAPPPRLTPPGHVAVMACVFSLAAGLVTLSASLLSAGLAGGLFLLACRHLAARHLAGFQVGRRLPRRARAGESFALEVLPSAGPSFPRGIEVQLTVPHAPAVQDRPLAPTEAGDRPLRCSGFVSRRGPLPRRPWTVKSTWPAGLFLTERQGYCRDDHSTLVLPLPWMPPRLHQRVLELSRETRGRPRGLADPLEELRLLREFRAGDPVRGIHWPASLRTGRLHLAETEPPRQRPLRFGILLHSWESPGSIVIPESYETVLRIVAALLALFQRDAVATVFCQAPGTPRTLRTKADFTAALDALALSRRRPVSSLAGVFARPGTREEDPYANCDEVFVIGDSALAAWEPSVRDRFSRCTCLDPATLTLPSRPGLYLPSRARFTP